MDGDEAWRRNVEAILRADQPADSGTPDPQPAHRPGPAGWWDRLADQDRRASQRDVPHALNWIGFPIVLRYRRRVAVIAVTALTVYLALSQ